MIQKDESNEYSVLFKEVGITDQAEQKEIELFLFQLGIIIFRHINHEEENKCGRIQQVAA